MSDPLGIALVGCGTVGGGVAKILLTHPDRLAQRAGRPLALRTVVVRDPSKPRAADVPAGLLTTDVAAAIDDPAERGLSYAAALAEAQQRGYAEADPTLDVDGSDAAHKLAVLAQIAFGVAARPHEIERQGIDTLDAMDIRFAGELGYTIKLLAEAWTDLASGGREPPGGPLRVALHVAPVLLRHTDLLAQVRGAYNAIAVYGDI